MRDRGHVRSKALVVAYAVHETGCREVIGIDIGETESEAFWTEFLRGLVGRGLAGVRLAISDEHQGLKSAIQRILACPWQRCTVHFVRNMHGHCRRSERGLVSAALREISTPPTPKSAGERFDAVAGALARGRPQGRRTPGGRRGGLLAFYASRRRTGRKLRSTKPLERVNKEIGRRSDVVGIFPNDASAIRLAGALLIEQNDEWLVARRYLSAELIALVLEDQGDEAREEVVELQAA